jgi:hypothetical protein
MEPHVEPGCRNKNASLFEALACIKHIECQNLFLLKIGNPVEETGEKYTTGWGDVL